MWLTTEQKGKLSDVEQQLKKAEAAQRRRMQVEKAARESEVCFILLFILLSFTFNFFGVLELEISVIELCRLRLLEKYSVKIPAGRSAKTR